jgi:pyruvate formate lyase activating enzyme
MDHGECAPVGGSVVAGLGEDHDRSSPAIGRVQSIESCGLFDGPGIRMVVFLQGCPLRCRYCHNPDTWDGRIGTEMTVEQVVAKARQFRPFLERRGGGITVGGGEPLLQRRFLRGLLRELKTEGFRTCIDTSGHAPVDVLTREILSYTDLVLLDLKAMPQDHRAVTGRTIDRTLAFLDLLTDLMVPTWIRHVVVPGLTGTPAHGAWMAELLCGRRHVERIELLPFHRMGVSKYERLGLADPLPGIQPPTAAEMAAAAEPLRALGIEVRA